MKMSKSLGNTIVPEQVVKQYGADILRLWVAQTDYTSITDRAGNPERSRRQLSPIAQYDAVHAGLAGRLSGSDRVAPQDMPELERWVLHRLAELDERCAKGTSL